MHLKKSVFILIKWMWLLRSYSQLSMRRSIWGSYFRVARPHGVLHVAKYAFCVRCVWDTKRHTFGFRSVLGSTIWPISCRVVSCSLLYVIWSQPRNIGCLALHTTAHVDWLHTWNHSQEYTIQMCTECMLLDQCPHLIPNTHHIAILCSFIGCWSNTPSVN